MLFASNTTILTVTNETAMDPAQNIMCSTVDSTAEKICKLFAYCVILLGSFFGNSFIIIIFCKHRDLRKTVNYFIVNMAVSDLLSSLTVFPVVITGLLNDSLHLRVRGILGLILCKLFYFMGPVSTFVSSQSLVWIAIDRFVAVVFPMKLGLISTKTRTITIVSTWSFAGVLNFPKLIISRLVQYGNDTTCGIITGSMFTSQKAITAYNWLQMAFYFFVPLYFTAILYTTIAIFLKQRSKALIDTAPNVQRHSLRKRRQAIQMTVVTVVLFYICVIPYTLLNILPYTHWRPSCSFQRLFYFLSAFMIYSSSVVNPMICLSFVESYRRGLRNILCPCASRKWNIKLAKREQITLKNIKILPGENCSQTSKETAKFHEEALDTVP